MIGIYSPGIWRIPHLEKFLAQPCQKLSLLRPVPQEVDAIAVWGHRPSAAKPVAIAKAAGKPVIRLEDGFVRSLDLGVNGEPPLSLVVDDCCIYYDASKPSALEKLVQDKAGNTALISQAREAMHTIVTGDLSKYNLAPAFVADESERSDIVLVVDQTFNDMSVTYGNAGPHEFAAMLEAAMAENPQAEIWVKVHPDVLEGKKTGYFAALRATQRVRLIAENVSPQSLLRHVSRVYVVTSQYGFEALLAGKPGDMLRPALVCRLGLNRRSPSAVRFVICPTRFCHAGGTFCRCIPALLSLYRSANGRSKQSIYRAAMAAITTSTSATA